MEKVSEVLRKTTTFLLAVFVWFHALFLLNIHSSFAAKVGHYMRLTASETIILAILVIFSFASGSGFWKPFRSALYIYAFPFVLFWKALYWTFQVLRAVNRWFKRQTYDASSSTEKPDSIVVAAPPKKPLRSRSEKVKELVKFLIRPFRRFVWLWCILLLLSTHIEIIWTCLLVILIHLFRRIFTVVKVMLFFDPYLKRGIEAFFEVVGNAMDAISGVTPETKPSNELKTRWSQVKGWRAITGFLKNNYLVSRWAWVLGFTSFGLIYIYFALLFSFVYFGLARVSGIPYSWGNALVSSLFIPLFASDLPKTITFRLVGGLQVALVLAVGFGTFFSFLQRRLNVVLIAAGVVNDKLVEQTFEEKFAILDRALAKNQPLT